MYKDKMKAQTIISLWASYLSVLVVDWRKVGVEGMFNDLVTQRNCKNGKRWPCSILIISLLLSCLPPVFFFLSSPGTNLSYYKGEPEFSAGEPPLQRFNLTGAEAIPDVDVGKRKYAMNIILPSSDETGEIRLIFENVRES